MGASGNYIELTDPQERGRPIEPSDYLMGISIPSGETALDTLQEIITKHVVPLIPSDSATSASVSQAIMNGVASWALKNNPALIPLSKNDLNAWEDWIFRQESGYKDKEVLIAGADRILGHQSLQRLVFDTGETRPTTGKMYLDIQGKTVEISASALDALTGESVGASALDGNGNPRTDAVLVIGGAVSEYEDEHFGVTLYVAKDVDHDDGLLVQTSAAANLDRHIILTAIEDESVYTRTATLAGNTLTFPWRRGEQKGQDAFQLPHTAVLPGAIETVPPDLFFLAMLGNSTNWQPDSSVSTQHILPIEGSFEVKIGTSVVVLSDDFTFENLRSKTGVTAGTSTGTNDDDYSIEIPWAAAATKPRIGWNSTTQKVVFFNNTGAPSQNFEVVSHVRFKQRDPLVYYDQEITVTAQNRNTYIADPDAVAFPADRDIDVYDDDLDVEDVTPHIFGDLSEKSAGDPAQDQHGAAIGTVVDWDHEGQDWFVAKKSDGEFIVAPGSANTIGRKTRIRLQEQPVAYVLVSALPHLVLSILAKHPAVSTDGTTWTTQWRKEDMVREVQTALNNAENTLDWARDAVTQVPADKLPFIDVVSVSTLAELQASRNGPVVLQVTTEIVDGSTTYLAGDFLIQTGASTYVSLTEHVSTGIADLPSGTPPDGVLVRAGSPETTYEISVDGLRALIQNDVVKVGDAFPSNPIDGELFILSQENNSLGNFVDQDGRTKQGGKFRDWFRYRLSNTTWYRVLPASNFPASWGVDGNLSLIPRDKLPGAVEYLSALPGTDEREVGAIVSVSDVEYHLKSVSRTVTARNTDSFTIAGNPLQFNKQVDNDFLYPGHQDGSNVVVFVRTDWTGFNADDNGTIRISGTGVSSAVTLTRQDRLSWVSADGHLYARYIGAGQLVAGNNRTLAFADSNGNAINWRDAWEYGVRSWVDIHEDFVRKGTELYPAHRKAGFASGTHRQYQGTEQTSRVPRYFSLSFPAANWNPNTYRPNPGQTAFNNSYVNAVGSWIDDEGHQHTGFPGGIHNITYHHNNHPDHRLRGRVSIDFYGDVYHSFGPHNWLFYLNSESEAQQRTYALVSDQSRTDDVVTAIQLQASDRPQDSQGRPRDISGFSDLTNVDGVYLSVRAESDEVVAIDADDIGRDVRFRKIWELNDNHWAFVRTGTDDSWMVTNDNNPLPSLDLNQFRRGSKFWLMFRQANHSGFQNCWSLNWLMDEWLDQNKVGSTVSNLSDDRDFSAGSHVNANPRRDVLHQANTPFNYDGSNCMRGNLQGQILFYLGMWVNNHLAIAFQHVSYMSAGSKLELWIEGG